MIQDKYVYYLIYLSLDYLDNYYYMNLPLQEGRKDKVLFFSVEIDQRYFSKCPSNFQPQYGFGITLKLNSSFKVETFSGSP